MFVSVCHLSASQSASIRNGINSMASDDMMMSIELTIQLNEEIRGVDHMKMRMEL